MFKLTVLCLSIHCCLIVSNQLVSSGTWCTLLFPGFHFAFSQHDLTLLPSVNISVKKPVQYCHLPWRCHDDFHGPFLCRGIEKSRTVTVAFLVFLMHDCELNLCWCHCLLDNSPVSALHRISYLLKAYPILSPQLPLALHLIIQLLLLHHLLVQLPLLFLLNRYSIKRFFM